MNAGLVRAGGWGIFCACSWTWCIGMFLPVIMLERYGWAGFLVFAVPNVLGCAAFGYVLGGPEASRRMVSRHARMLRSFSWVTIAYHCFFVGLVAYVLWPGTAGHWAGPLLAAAALMIAAVLISRVPMAVWPVLAIAVYLVSLGVWGGIGTGGLETWAWTGERSAMEVIWLAPVIAVGFVLCPYFDLTFHQALQASGSRHTFAVFGVAFAAMLVLTAAYADRIGSVMSGLVLTHFAAQSVFTVAAHWRALHPHQSAAETFARPGSMIALIVVSALVYAVSLAEQPYDAGVAWYLRFLVFYGLVFPAMALWFMRFRGDADSPSRAAVIAAALLIGVAMPFYEIGFIHHWTVLPAIALAMVVAGAVVYRSVAGHSQGESDWSVM